MIITAAARATGEALTKQFERCRLRPYLDSGSPRNWTIGWGTRTLMDGRPVTARTLPISQATADALFDRAFGLIIPALEAVVTVPLTDNQGGALLSMTYNIGSAAMAGSSLMRALNAGDYAAAADDMLDWDRTGNTVSAGLLDRRKIERAIFLGAAQPSPAPELDATDALNQAQLDANGGTAS